MTVLIPTRRGFPRAPVVLIPRRRGLGDTWLIDDAIDAIFGQGTAYNLNTGALAPTQLVAQQTADNAANLQAATNPITGQVNKNLLATANAKTAQETAQASNVSNISTGSWWANANDKLQGTYNPNLGWPGSTPPLGTTVPSPTPSSPTDWMSILKTAAIVGGLSLGAYLVIQLVTK